MNSPPFRRGHRKRISALRLSSDSNATLPVYTSPPWQRSVDLPVVLDISDRPPDYPDSSEEGDADIDSDDEQPARSTYSSPSPSLSYSSPRRSPNRRSGHSRKGSIRRSQQSSNDPYLDSLLARSVHALELSNTLLQTSMSTQTSLSTVLASDNSADTTLETHAQNISSRISGNDKLQSSLLDDLNKLSSGVDDLLGDEDQMGAISQSLPTSSSGLSARIQGSHLRRPSLDFRSRGRSTTDSQLQLSNHGRRDLIAPAPRALTMYVDSTDDPTAIILPPTLGLRSSATLPRTPLPSESTFPSDGSPSLSTAALDQPKRAVDVLSSYIIRRPSTRRSSTSTSSTTAVSSSLKRRRSKSPPPPSRTSPSIRGRSVTPARDTSSHSSPSIRSRPLIPIPSIEELSASSDSSSSDTMHVDRTLESLRTILEKQPPPPVIRPKSPARPALLLPPTVAPVQGTSTATASVSRLFTKSRHSSSTRPPSPPRHSALKRSSAPPTPTHTPSPSLSMLSIPDLMSPFGFGSISLSNSASGSGNTTPKRISFAELPPRTARSESAKTMKRSRSKGKGKRRAGSTGSGGESSGGENGWWTTWLMGAAGSGSTSASGLGMAAARRGEDKLRSASWSARPGFGNSLEDWAM
ncbi:hypothetical protein BXZ70DRAFT_330487 [Cristinia sonorae]|uniref:Uncharacterized protein n=1 Tax=Cristinia sonorae TaxID=1940300 RepID=A0A8K0UK73_9AGAR|nr:hypothetical protein BXZ70DRAFT_330487 [Cristinia sonorae]